MYLLDYSGEVEVTNVTNSQIFIGASLEGRWAACSALMGHHAERGASVHAHKVESVLCMRLTPTPCCRPGRWPGHL